MIKKHLNPIIIGKICSPYGILGWNKMFSFTENKKSIFKYSPLFYFKSNIINSLKIVQWKSIKNYFLIKIKNVNDRNTASLFTNKKIFIYSNQIQKKNNEYLWNEILLCKIFNINKNFLGIVVKILRTYTNDILIVKKNNCKEILIPFIKKKIIKRIHIKKKKIIVNWRE
ncbi:ribosome maturation factor RimM [Buchnera aphidicola]|uniref:ribosome maturation factor RimM n=1 Tax=Buchnera aphidicola TaxID=9 RepID=UPI0022377205|nr:ribosome maturation factor RimM [Buchnera aphidicola]MCW5197566.1 ribosome maturation factor RimM [Buchnera aphidicola (Chaitophorus viminalis)]